MVAYTELTSKIVVEVAWPGEAAAKTGASVCVEEMSHSNTSQISFTVNLPTAANDGVSEDVPVITSHSLQVANHYVSLGVGPSPVGEGMQGNCADSRIHIPSVGVPFGPVP